MSKINVSFSLEKSLADAIVAEAAKQNRPKSWVVAQILGGILDPVKKPKPTK